jgi:hypothetical protein
MYGGKKNYLRPVTFMREIYSSSRKKSRSAGAGAGGITGISFDFEYLGEIKLIFE